MSRMLGVVLQSAQNIGVCTLTIMHHVRMCINGIMYKDVHIHIILHTHVHDKVSPYYIMFMINFACNFTPASTALLVE